MEMEQRVSPQKLAKGLGWFSIGLGLAEIITPNGVANLIGIEDDGKTKNVLRAYGLRELAAGIGLLSGMNPSGWLWGRVAGDLLDLSSLGKALTSDDNDRGRAIAAAAAVAGVTAADVYCAMQLSSAQEDGQARETRAPIKSSITIGRNADEIYGFWRDFARLPEIFDRLESVQTLGGGRSHWRLALPMNRTLEWDAEMTDEQPNRRIAWRSVSGPARHSGSVVFERAAGQRGTMVTVEIRPEGIGTTLGKLFGLIPEQHVNIALHNLKQLLETGEIAKSDASIHRGMHPAQPPEQYNGRANAASV